MASSAPNSPSQLPAYFEALVASSNDVIVTESMDGTILSFNPAAERLYGLRAEDVIGRPVAEVHPTSQSGRIREARMAARRGEYVPPLETTRAATHGRLLELSVGFSPIRDERGAVIGITAIVRDISHRPDAQQELQVRARQQAAVAWFGQRALASTSLDELLSDAVELIIRTLGVEFVTLLEVTPDKSALLLRAGTGWRPGLIGTTVAKIARTSPAGLALIGGEPVIVTDLTNDPLFPGPSFLHDHGIVSEMSVVVRGPKEPFGVVGAHSAGEHAFSVDDLHFLEAIANILAMASSRFTDLELLEQRIEERARLAAIVESSHDAIMSETLDGIIVTWNPAAERLYGISAADAIGKSVYALIPSAYDPQVVASMERVRAGMDVDAFEAKRTCSDGGVRDVSIKLSPVRIGDEVVGVSAILRDITDRVRTRRELSEQRRMLSTLLDNLPGMAYRCLNEPSWPMEFVSDGCHELTGYSPESLMKLYAGYTSIIHPDDHASVWSSVQDAIAKDESFRFTYRIITAAGEEKWVLEQGCGVTSPSDELVALEGFITDITDRVLIQQELHDRLAQQDAIAQLGQRALASTDLDTLLSDAMEVVKSGLGVELIKILKWNSAQQTFLLRAGIGWKPGLVGQFTLDGAGESQAAYALRAGEPVVVSDLRTETRFKTAPLLHDHDVVSGISVVLDAPDGPLGVLGAHTTRRRAFTSDDVSFLQSVANIVANGIERARAFLELGLRVEERTRELRTLLDISHDAAATLELGTLAELILDRIRGLVDYTGAAIYVLDESCEALNLLRYQGPIPLHQLNYRWTLATHDHARATIESDQPLIINDVFSDEPLAEALRRNAIRDLGELRADFGSWMSVPMKIGERVIGMLSVEIDRKDCYTKHHAELLMAVADQAAVAVENARLYEQARGLAALEERQKLARDLHDSVSQALFGIGLGARTARTLLDRDPAKVAEPLDYVVSLAEAGLTEMRALIFELRPESLELEGLVGSLEKQLAALRARHGLLIEADLCPEPAAAFNVKETLYRIAQEALNNVVKHARASSVRVQMTDSERGIRLEIVDDGVGFDPTGNFPGHLGLRSMRERAARIGAVLDVESAPGRGARTSVRVPPAT